MEHIFLHIYRHNVWGDPESISGPGSGLVRTASFRDHIPQLLSELGAISFLDAGCGDFNWMKELELPVEQYFGMDVVSELVIRNQQKHSDSKIFFLHGDIVRDELPQVDVILCRDCLVHFSFEDLWAALRNFKKSQSRYLLTTTFIDFPENSDIETGGWRKLNLERHPFYFPPPERLIDEKCLLSDATDKRLALWRLDDIATR